MSPLISRDEETFAVTVPAFGSDTTRRSKTESTRNMITFAKLLNARFGAHVPSDLAQASQSQWDAWLQAIADRPDAALNLLSSVDTAARRFELALWEPSLAFEAKQHLMRLLKVRMTRKDADKPALAQRIEMRTGELTAIDAARTVAFD
jgi:hypothetical protein